MAVPQPSAPSLDSRIISTFPEIFSEFRGKQFSLLWRGSRDGFKSSDFHRLCDGHHNTLTVILDTEGNIFGGFTPSEWESRIWNQKDGDGDNRWKEDYTLKTFVFAIRIELTNEWNQLAIGCDSIRGPFFYGAIVVVDDCNGNSESSTYLRDVGAEGQILGVRSAGFKVEEIEVFEIED
jgi:hypothetical protein